LFERIWCLEKREREAGDRGKRSGQRKKPAGKKLQDWGKRSGPASCAAGEPEPARGPDSIRRIVVRVDAS